MFAPDYPLRQPLQPQLRPRQLIGDQDPGELVGGRAGWHDSTNQRASSWPRELEALAAPRVRDVRDQAIPRPAGDDSTDARLAQT